MFNSKNMNIITLQHFGKNGFKHEKFNHGGLFVVYANWCSFCQDLKPTWKQLYKEGKKLEYKIAAVDAMKNQELVHMLGIQGYPTILVVMKNGKIKEYTGPRTLEALKKKFPKLRQNKTKK